MERILQSRREQVQADAAALDAAGANQLVMPGRDPSAAGGAPSSSTEPLVTPDSVGWAAAVLLSRAFSLYLSSETDHAIMPMEDFGSWDRTGQDVLALVPWADLLQHSSEAGGWTSGGRMQRVCCSEGGHLHVHRAGVGGCVCLHMPRC